MIYYTLMYCFHIPTGSFGYEPVNAWKIIMCQVKEERLPQAGLKYVRYSIVMDCCVPVRYALL